MIQRPGNAEKVFVLTERPQDKVAALDWRPFKSGNTLGEMITAHNIRCNGLLKEKTPRPFADCLAEITPALTINTNLQKGPGPYAYNEVNNLKILLLDLDRGGFNPRELEPIRADLERKKRTVHLIQVSHSSKSISQAQYFGDESCILSTNPEVFRQQSDLECFLHAFREAYEAGWRGVVQNPFDASCLEKVYNEPYIHPRRGHFLRPGSEKGRSIKRVYREYRRAMPELLSEVRDAAIARELEEEQVVNLGRAAAVQELLLTLIIERVRPRPGYPISVRSIRIPSLEIPADRPLGMKELRPRKLLELRLSGPIGRLSQEQHRALTDLGFTAGARVSVQFDRPGVWERIALVEDTVRSERFAADLPSWRVNPRQPRVCLNENAFGLPIKESVTIDISRDNWPDIAVQ
jgi:hypothetical protein